MKKLNLLTLSLATVGMILCSCSKDTESGIDENSFDPTTKDVVDAKCWDKNKNGTPDEEEDVNKDGKVNVDDCITK